MEEALKTQQIGQAVEHVNEKDIGRLSAEAVLTQYEATAKAVETMGTEVKDRIAKLEAAMREADEALKLVAEAAHSIRERGKLVQVQIEEATQLSKEIRDTCAEFRRKVGA
jgi:transposase-like protein